jgi:hypothetical protein
VANKQYIERLQMALNHLHGCNSTWIESVPVHEVFRGQTVWRGIVEVFDLAGHPKAKRAYGWSHRDGPQDKDERFVTVLGLPPVDSAQVAVKVAAATEIKQRRK